MKQAENNDMDLLLRSLARRKGSKPFPREPMTEGSAESAHLDADELVSYAEQTLPSATRARYTIHLADCARCRKIVAELAPAVSVGVRDHPEGQSGTTFWQTVGHFFSLPVWRYAVPALGLFAIVVVGLVVFRNQQPRSDMVAQNGRATERVAVTQSQPTEVPQEKAAGTDERGYLADSAPNLNAQEKAKSGEHGQATGAGAAVPAPGAVAPIAKDAPAEKTAEAVAQPTFAPEPPPPAPKPQAQVANARKETVARTEAASRPQAPPAKAPDTDREAYEGRGERTAEEEKSRAKNEPREAQGAGVPATDAARGRDNLARLRSTQTLRTDSAGKKKSDDETAETRAVAGRRFSRQGNLWVDTAYHPGLSLTVVSRGSEQYRALVADEPSIRTIAEQLQGELIVIWKGRGYRIR